MIEPFIFCGRKIWLLRDDLLGVFNGNKARKLEYFLNADLSGVSRIVSNGSSQSNAMYSLSVFAKMRGLKFSYVVSHLSKNLEREPVGNLKFALENGMEIFVNQNRREFARELAKKEGALFIEEGVAQKEAEAGFKTQACEIKAWANERGFCGARERNFEGRTSSEQNLGSKILDIFLPSGTGASAAYLAKNCEFNVFTCPCVGDIKYLKSEILALDPHSRVKILPPPKKYHFGDLKPELYEIWRRTLENSGVEFDLIYDPVGLLTLKENLADFKNEILYIHQGGILGNVSQKARYERKFKTEGK